MYWSRQEFSFVLLSKILVYDFAIESRDSHHSNKLHLKSQKTKN